MLDTKDIADNATLEAIARLAFDHDFQQLQRVLLSQRVASLELLASEHEQDRLRQLQGEVALLKQVLAFPGACKAALEKRRAGSK